MAPPADSKRRVTYQDILEVPDTKVAEILDGELYVWPRPAPPHAVAGSGLGAELLGPFHTGRRGPGGWWILYEPELHLGEDIAVPDWAGWRRERMPQPPPEAFFSLAPDWICEILSPGTESADRVKKLPIYAREGVRHAWLIDPLARTLEVYRLEDGNWVEVARHGGGEMVRAEPFAAVEVDLLALWGESRTG